MNERKYLVGFAIDLSSSMKSSIKNRTGGHFNRFDSIKKSLDKLFSKARSEIQKQKISRNNGSQKIFFFIYGFGLKFAKYCDLLTLLKASEDLSNTNNSGLKVDLSKFQKFSNPFSILENIASRYDKEGWGYRCSKIFSSSEAELLANILLQNTHKAGEICNQLPRNMLTGGAGYKFGKTFGTGSKIERAEDQANRLMDEIKVHIKNYQENLAEKVNRIGYTTIPIEEVGERFIDKGESSFDSIESIIYGDTPMVSTLKEIRKRFHYEESKKVKLEKKILFIISDGEPTDGNPNELFVNLKNDNVIIVSCLITSKDIANPRRLFNYVASDWDEGVRLMYNNASLIESNSDFEGFLLSKGWSIPPNSKLFIQINHSEVLEEFTDMFLSLIKE